MKTQIKQFTRMVFLVVGFLTLSSIPTLQGAIMYWELNGTNGVTVKAGFGETNSNIGFDPINRHYVVSSQWSVIDDNYNADFSGTWTFPLEMRYVILGGAITPARPYIKAAGLGNSSPLYNYAYGDTIDSSIVNWNGGNANATLAEGQTGYMALSLQTASGMTWYYGWLKYKREDALSYTLYSTGYNTLAGAPILAGEGGPIPVPEPSIYALIALGMILAGVGIYKRHSNRVKIS